MKLVISSFGVFLCATAFFTAVWAAPQGGRHFPIRLQPELDAVDVDSYLKNERLFNFQLKCLMDEGPCDILGRWLKPRVARALLGECPLCTPIQKEKIDRVLDDMQTNRPEIYRGLVVKFLSNAGIQIDVPEKKPAEQQQPKPTENADKPAQETVEVPPLNEQSEPTATVPVAIMIVDESATDASAV